MIKPLSKLITLGAIFLLGAWLATRLVSPAPESSTRLGALGALAPGRPNSGGSGAAAPLADFGKAEPLEVDLASLPTGPDDGGGLKARYLRGDIDLTENESILPAAEIAALKERSLVMPPSAAIQSAPEQAGSADGSAPSPDAPVIGANFLALDYNDSGGFVPPDPQLAAGPNHLIAVVNSTFAIYNKTGSRLRAPTSFASLFNSNQACTGFLFDPNVVYDESADRFILAIDADGTHYCVAASATGDPLGVWRIYAFQTASGNDFFDYPHAGIGRDFLFMGANIFGPVSFKEGRVWAFDKADLYAGRAVDFATKPLPTSEDTPQPLHLHGWNQGTWPATSVHYFFTDTDYNGDTYSVWSWNNPLGGRSPALVGEVNLSSFTGVATGYPIDAPQSGSAARIQANDYRPHDFEYRDGFAWSAQTIACNPGGGTVNCLRWAKINPATAAVVDAGVYASSGQHRIFGDLAVNDCGDMAIGYTKTGSSLLPGIFVTGRRAGDPPGTLQVETMARAGAIAYTAFDGSPHRWGDYTGMTIDPDGERFWYLGQFSKNTGTAAGRWGTAITSFSYNGCGGGGSNPSVELSAKSKGTVGGLSFTAADIVRFSSATGQWTMRLDASDIGITKNVTAFYREARPGGLDIYYLVLAAGQTLPNVGAVTPFDVIKFTPTELGANTAGTFAWYFDGSDVGLTQSGEKIDALDMDESGRLLISLAGSGSVPRAGGNLRLADEDIAAFTLSATGTSTAGTWAGYFDGSAAVTGLATEDITGFWDDPSTGDLYVSLGESFNLGGVSGGAGDIIRLVPGSGGAYTPFMIWNGELVGYGFSIDALEMGIE